MKILKILFIVVLVLIALVFSAKLILLDTPPRLPDTSEFPMDLAVLHELADAPPDSLPLRLNLLEIASVEFPRTIVIAGGGWGMHRLYFSALQVIYPDQTILIDPVHSKPVQEIVFPDGIYHEAQYDAMQEAMREAYLILATHEHIDHVGGILSSPYLDEIRDRVQLTREQIESLKADPEVAKYYDQGLFDAFQPLSYDRYHVVAPGLVLIKAPGHTPGTQMMYLRLQNGETYLLVGDVVWHMDNIREETGRPWLTNILGSEDRDALAHQLRALHTVYSAGTPHLLVAHDSVQHQAYISRGLIGEAFE